jgi:enterochelin esterase-like enzyme
MTFSRESSLISKLEADLLNSSDKREDILNNFWRNNKFPLMEAIPDDENNVKYTFVLRRDLSTGEPQDRYLVSDHRFGSPIKVTDDELLNNVSGTDVNYVTMIFPADARFRYGFVEFPKDQIKKIFADGETEYANLQSTNEKFAFYGLPVSKIVDENRFKDPLNSRLPTGDAEAQANFSLLVGPKAVQPISESGAEYDPTRLKEYVMDDKKYWIYLPKDYDPARAEPYPLNIFLDGKQYIDEVHAPIMLDKLTRENKIPPGIAVFVAAPEDVMQRYQTYHTNDEFTHFIAEKLIPAIQQRPDLNCAATCTLTGFSLSGLTAAYIGLKHPELVSNVVSQSGAFWTDSAGSSLILRNDLPKDLKTLEGLAETAFVLVKDELFFVDKNKNSITPVSMTSQQLDSLKKELDIKPLAKDKPVVKFDPIPLYLMQRLTAIIPASPAPPYKMMAAIESFVAKKGTTQFKLQAGSFEVSVNTHNGITTSNIHLDSLLTCNKTFNAILQSRGIQSDFSAAAHAHTADGCEATLAKPLQSVLKRQMSSTAAIMQSAGIQNASPQTVHTPAPAKLEPKEPELKAEKKEVNDNNARPRPRR